MLKTYELFDQVEKIAVNTARRYKTIDENIGNVRNTLKHLATNQENLQAKIDKARSLRWNGAAIPDPEVLVEPIDQAFDLPEVPPRFNIVAADGSQVLPDRHGIALYYAINIGGIIFRHGIVNTPEERTETIVESSDDALYNKQGIIPNERINARRDLGELKMLKEMCASESKEDHTVALLDNGLLPVFLDRTQEGNEWQKFINDSLLFLSVLQDLKYASVAGVVNRPRATHVVNLLHLSTFEDVNSVNQDTLNAKGNFEHITDARLFMELLKPRQRSAIFFTDSSLNREEYKGKHEIHFFYLNVSDNPKYPVILRIEIPRWVAADPIKQNIVHAAIYSQCQVMSNAPFPYVLTRAHELAVITSEDRRVFEGEIASALIRNGIMPQQSEKQQGKNMLKRRSQ